MMACLSAIVRCDNSNRGAVCCCLGGNTGNPGPALEQQSQVRQHARWLCPSDMHMVQLAQRAGVAHIDKAWIYEALSSQSFSRAYGICISASKTDPSSDLLRGRCFAVISSPDVAAMKTNVEGLIFFTMALYQGRFSAHKLLDQHNRGGLKQC